MDANLEKLIRFLVTRSSHAEQVEGLCHELGIDRAALQDLVALNASLFDSVHTNRRQAGLASVGLGADGRQAAYRLGILGASPVADAETIRNHLSSVEGGHASVSSEKLDLALGFGSVRLQDAVFLLERDGRAKAEHVLGGRFHISLSAFGRAEVTVDAVEAKPDVPLNEPTPSQSGEQAHYIHGHVLAGASGLTWQHTTWRGSPCVRIAFHTSSNKKLQRRQTLEVVTRAIAAVTERNPDEVAWLAIGKRTWNIDATRLRQTFPFLGELGWLGVGTVVLEPEIEEDERETFGRRSFTASVCLYITPDSAVPSLPAVARLRVLVFHGPDNAPKHELLAWLRGQDIMADARTVGEMNPNAEGTVDERVRLAIEWADKAIAIVSPDPRSPTGAPNVIDEIGRWRGSGRDADLAIVRSRDCADIWSNLSGVVRLEYDERVKETFLGLAKFLGSLVPHRKGLPLSGEHPVPAATMTMAVPTATTTRPISLIREEVLRGTYQRLRQVHRTTLSLINPVQVDGSDEQSKADGETRRWMEHDSTWCELQEFHLSNALYLGARVDGLVNHYMAGIVRAVAGWRAGSQSRGNVYDWSNAFSGLKALGETTLEQITREIRDALGIRDAPSGSDSPDSSRDP